MCFREIEREREREKERERGGGGRGRGREDNSERRGLSDVSEKQGEAERDCLTSMGDGVRGERKRYNYT